MEIQQIYLKFSMGAMIFLFLYLIFFLNWGSLKIQTFLRDINLLSNNLILEIKIFS
jgi:hypothetical protein